MQKTGDKGTDIPAIEAAYRTRDKTEKHRVHTSLYGTTFVLRGYQPTSR